MPTSDNAKPATPNIELIINKRIEDVLPSPKPSFCFPERGFMTRSIKEGLRKHCITVWDKNGQLIVVDGYAIIRICQREYLCITEANIYRMNFNSLTEALYWRICHNIKNRNMSSDERCMAALKYKPLFIKVGKMRMAREQKGLCEQRERWNTNQELEDTFSVKIIMVQMLERILESSDKGIKKKVLTGRLGIKDAYMKLFGAKTDKRISYHYLRPEEELAFSKMKIFASTYFHRQQFDILTDLLTFFKPSCMELTIENRRVCVKSWAPYITCWAELPRLFPTARKIHISNVPRFLICLKRISAIKFPVRLDFGVYENMNFYNFSDANNKSIFGWDNSDIIDDNKYFINPPIDAAILDDKLRVIGPPIASGTLDDVALWTFRAAQDHYGHHTMLFDKNRMRLIFSRTNVCYRHGYFQPFLCKANPKYDGRAINVWELSTLLPKLWSLNIEVYQSATRDDGVIVSLYAYEKWILFGWWLEKSFDNTKKDLKKMLPQTQDNGCSNMFEYPLSVIGSEMNE